MTKIKMNIEPVLRCLPKSISAAAAKYEATEIRLLAGRPAMLYTGTDGFFVTSAGDITTSEDSAIEMTKTGVGEVFRLACDNSVYSFEDEIKNGYITIEGGHRIGICGSAVIKNGEITYIKNISALNIRIARQVIGCAKDIFPAVFDKYVRNTLIVSPPGCGKTTVLRDLARILGYKYKVGIADERSEIAAVYRGTPQNDVGLRTVVMDACPKEYGINMILRTMGVDIIITDEIGNSTDGEAIQNAFNAGVKIIASAHGYSKADVLARPAIKGLMVTGGFERVVVLSRRNGAGTIEEVSECR